ncbi:hypothetical protein JKA74_03400 [Marivirga sp. S37H4]|uniref:histidine kinase n=1 Tax=Marivirga aurantiaca TaxID=2802615 RepID=A0A935C5U8_9BACT|nr:ATP-binding protein [Marivirga aurantiaca]MBK6264071.1 hypothetical protein [Marivirga aurantiaca]
MKQQSEESKVTILGNEKFNTFAARKEQALDLDANVINKEDFFHYSESLADMGVCDINLVSKKINFSDNLYRILGFEPGSFTPTVKKIFELVHPDDIRHLKGVTKIGTHNTHKEIGASRIRIITKENAIKYISLKNQLLEETDNTIIMVAIKDVTTETLITLSLEEQNQELMRSNSELASFSQIASHDLQEPLRKIQIFISRLEQMEEMRLSPKVGDYISKIQLTANRMQMLIVDLLAFSRISKSEEEFEYTSLQGILQDALHEISFDIEEKKAVINIDPLPFGKVIPFQIQQLFVNLLNNSLKYSKADIAPVISIKNEQPNTKELEKFSPKQEQELIKISVEDNGIGFNQSDAENIFLIFKRLHGKLEYSGTGIGLAICKSIVENHGGTIEAKGTLGEGAKISFIILSNPPDRR